MKKRSPVLLLIRLLLAAALGALLAAAPAAGAEAESGLKAETLTVKVGYFGGPFYEKKIFTADELWHMDVVYEDYTYIDAMPSVVIDHAAGVRLTDILAAAGIDAGSVQQLHFWTRDKSGGYFTSFLKTELLGKPRYCFYSLPAHFTLEGGLEAAAAAEARPVPVLIALADEWERVIAGAEFGSDFLALDESTRYRLLFGQTEAAEQAASRSAKWVHAIEGVLGGAPTVTLDAAALELEVGSVFRATARVRADDPLISAGLSVSWQSSDESVAVVDGEGNIRVLGEGETVITASVTGAAASLSLGGVAGPGGPPAGGGAAEAAAEAESAGEAESADGAETAGAAEVRAVAEAAPVPEPAAPAATENQSGGVQNWRVFEMAATAAELPRIEETDWRRPAGAAAAAFFALGFAGRALRYRREI
jgi:hypothetical protein